MRRIILGLLASLLVASVLPTRATELELVPLVPDHVGLTAHFQHGLTVQKFPSLYFYNDRLGAWSQFISVRFTLIDASSMQPLAEIPLQLSAYPGLQRIQLGEYGIELKSETQYRWYISQIFNSDLPMPEISRKVINIAEGDIVRIDSKYLNYYGGPCTRDHIRRLKNARIWYDAFACVNELIEASPDDITLHDLRDELLGRCRHPYDRMPLGLCPR